MPGELGPAERIAGQPICLTVERGDLADKALDDEWTAFIARQNAGHSWQYHPAAVRALIGPHADGRKLVCIRARQGGDLVGIGLLQVFRQRLSLSFGRWNSFGWPGRIAVPFGPVMIQDQGADVPNFLPDLCDALKDVSNDFDILTIAHLDLADPLWEYCQRYGSRHGLTAVRLTSAVNRRYVLSLPQKTFEEFCASLGSSSRQVLRRRSRQLQGNGDSASELVQITAPDQIASFLQDVDQIYRDTWQCDLHGYRPRAAEADVIKFCQLAAAGLIRSYVLRYEQRPIAYQIGYQLGTTYWADEFGFAKQYASLSPGSVLMFRWLEDLFRENKPATVDLGDTDSGQKSMFRASPIEVISVAIAGRDRRRWFLRAQGMLTAVEGLVRHTARRCGYGR